MCHHLARNPSRRHFLKTAGATTLGTGLAPAIVGAADKSGSRLPIVGEGEYRYEALHG
jgi:hypothetical protein